LTIDSGTQWAILGANGSGKSTITRLFAGQLTPTEGTVCWYLPDQQPLARDQVYSWVSWMAPAIALPRQLLVRQVVGLHFRVKPCRLPGPAAVLESLELELHQNKEVRQLSSGLQQRLKMGLAILSDTPLLILDEPYSFLDTQGQRLVRDLLSLHVSTERTFILASNSPAEYEAIPNRMSLTR
jgi:ABC-type multidrug transport system ATPase subunit